MGYLGHQLADLQVRTGFCSTMQHESPYADGTKIHSDVKGTYSERQDGIPPPPPLPQTVGPMCRAGSRWHIPKA